MCPLSSSTLFHFTPTSANLIRILEQEFRPHYSLEDFRGVLGGSATARDVSVAIPMVCFCDIPLSQAHAHMDTYGRYAIGLTKDWGKSAGVSPVLYTYPGAATTEAMLRLHLDIEELRGTADDRAEFSYKTERFLCFVKPYTGALRRGNRVAEDVRFYDEREWRYVPPGPWLALNPDQFADGRTRDEANTHMRQRFRIPFEPRDVRYIVVEEDDEIAPMIRELRRIKSPKYSQNDIDVLCTRIVSARQIADDF